MIQNASLATTAIADAIAVVVTPPQSVSEGEGRARVGLLRKERALARKNAPILRTGVRCQNADRQWDGSSRRHLQRETRRLLPRCPALLLDTKKPPGHPRGYDCIRRGQNPRRGSHRRVGKRALRCHCITPIRANRLDLHSSRPPILLEQAPRIHRHIHP